mgnify:CR=1
MHRLAPELSVFVIAFSKRASVYQIQHEADRRTASCHPFSTLGFVTMTLLNVRFVQSVHKSDVGDGGDY